MKDPSTMRSAPAPRDVADMLTSGQRRWTLFLRRDDCTTWCAVPEGCPIPRFLLSGAWRYAGDGCAGLIAPRFRPPVADLAGSRMGFYFFRHFGWDRHRSDAGGEVRAPPLRIVSRSAIRSWPGREPC